MVDKTGIDLSEVLRTVGYIHVNEHAVVWGSFLDSDIVKVVRPKNTSLLKRYNIFSIFPTIVL